MLNCTPAPVVKVATNMNYLFKLSWRALWRGLLRMEILIIKSMIHFTIIHFGSAVGIKKDNNDNDHFEQS